MIQMLPSKYGADICCTIMHIRLDYPLVKYEALSYTWGNTKNPKWIQCNAKGRGLLVTDNRAGALRRLRRPNESRRVWIDAICINQEDIHERNV